MEKKKLLVLLTMFVFIMFISMNISGCSNDEYDEDESYTLASPVMTRAGESNLIKLKVNTDVTCYSSSGDFITVNVTGWAYKQGENGNRWGDVTCDVENFVNECTLMWTSKKSYLITVSFNKYTALGFEAYVGNKEVFLLY